MSLSINLKSFLSQYQNKNLKRISSPISIDGLFPLAFTSGVSVVSHLDRKKSAKLVQYYVSQLINQKMVKKVLHISLEEYISDVSTNYLALLSNIKTRDLKNPNFNITISKDVEKSIETIEIISIKNEESILTKIFNDIELLFESNKYDIVVFEGVDKILSKANREVVLTKLLDLLNLKSFELETAFVLAIKEENFKKNKNSFYTTVSNNDSIWTLSQNDKTQAVLLNQDYGSFTPINKPNANRHQTILPLKNMFELSFDDAFISDIKMEEVFSTMKDLNPSLEKITVTNQIRDFYSRFYNNNIEFKEKIKIFETMVGVKVPDNFSEVLELTSKDLTIFRHSEHYHSLTYVLEAIFQNIPINKDELFELIQLTYQKRSGDFPTLSDFYKVFKSKVSEDSSHLKMLKEFTKKGKYPFFDSKDEVQLTQSDLNSSNTVHKIYHILKHMY